MLNFNTIIIWTLMFEWYTVVRGLVLRIVIKKDMCLLEIRLCGQNALIVLGPVVNMIGGPM